METDTSRTPDPRKDGDEDDDPAEDEQATPFAPHSSDDTPLGDTNQHSTADA